MHAPTGLGDKNPIEGIESGCGTITITKTAIVENPIEGIESFLHIYLGER